MKKVLFLYITDVSGHHSAVNAVDQALKLFNPEIETKAVNAFKHTNPLTERLIHKIYLKVIKGRPQIWGHLYDNPKVFKRLQGMKRFIHRKNFRKIDELIEQFSPDAIVCTQAYPCGLVADYKSTYERDIPLIAVLTDFAGHAYWLYDQVNCFVVACNEAKERFVRDGIPGERIKVLGIPVHPKFSILHNREEIAKKLNIDLSIPTILIMGGGHGLGPVKKIIQFLDEIDISMQIIVVTGINASLLEWLKSMQNKLQKNIVALEYINNIDEIMEISSLLISKPGGLTSSEALSKNLPMIIMKPIPGQEENNTKYLLKEGVAVKVDSEEEVPKLVKRFLRNPELLNKMRIKSKKIAKPESAIEIAKLILNING
ncbi:glycosyltransferase [Candidatus Omnitrophota bacterium]